MINAFIDSKVKNSVLSKARTRQGYPLVFNTVFRGLS